MESLANPEIWVALATLTALELVLGIDNIIFISILAGKLPAQQRARRAARPRAGAVTRLLLLTLSWIVSLTAPLFSAVRARVLVARPDPARRRSVPDRQEHHEIHHKLEGATEQARAARRGRRSAA